MRSRAVKLTVIAALGASALVASAQASAQPPADTGRADDVAAFWTPEKIASAQPRDLVIDSRGLGYQRAKDGSLTPYGHSKPIRLEATTQARQVPNAKPSGGPNDSTPPLIGDRSPASGATINVTTADPIDFSAVLTDDVSGIASASIVIHLPNGSTQSFAAAPLGNNLWGTAIQGFTAGTWEWHVIARDGAGRGGNTATSDVYGFTITDGGGGGDPGGGGSGTVTNSRWALGGDIRGAAGRILFEMPTEVRRGRNITIEWNAYVCSGTAVTDSHDGASIILTAAHCVYDDVSKAFARNVLFIPNQDDGGTDRTDSDCTNDPFGCWSPTNGVVNLQWTNKTFPANVEWDYGYYVVPNTGAHSANGKTGDATPEALELAVNELTIGFGTANAGTTTHALGYSYSNDPDFMYCAEPMGVKTANVNWWLPGCDLSGGSSGGPWVQPMNEGAGNGPIISVNSWGYTTGPGMAGPFLGATASCTFGAANRAAAGQPPTPGVIPGVIASC